jgi:hypothetical protein
VADSACGAYEAIASSWPEFIPTFLRQSLLLGAGTAAYAAISPAIQPARCPIGPPMTGSMVHRAGGGVAELDVAELDVAGPGADGSWWGGLCRWLNHVVAATTCTRPRGCHNDVVGALG